MPVDYLAALRRESARFAEVLRGTDPAARVPSCPDWTADDLLYHLAEASLFWARVIEQRATDPDPIDAAKPAQPSERPELLALYDDCAAAVLAALESTADDVQVWTWSDDHTVGFIRRRMPHEALIHRIDAELTAGAPSEVDPALATDGAHELLQHFFSAPAWASYRGDGPLGRVQATDTGASWLVRVGAFSGLSPNTGKTYDNRPALGLVDSGTPSFTVSGSARDLDCWLWNRPPLVEPVVDGSDDDFRAFAAVITTGVD